MVNWTTIYSNKTVSKQNCTRINALLWLRFRFISPAGQRAAYPETGPQRFATQTKWETGRGGERWSPRGTGPDARRTRPGVVHLVRRRRRSVCRLRLGGTRGAASRRAFSHRQTLSRRCFLNLSVAAVLATCSPPERVLVTPFGTERQTTARCRGSDHGVGGAYTSSYRWCNIDHPWGALPPPHPPVETSKRFNDMRTNGRIRF